MGRRTTMRGAALALALGAAGLAAGAEGPYVLEVGRYRVTPAEFEQTLSWVTQGMHGLKPENVETEGFRKDFLRRLADRKLALEYAWARVVPEDAELRGRLENNARGECVNVLLPRKVELQKGTDAEARTAALAYADGLVDSRQGRDLTGGGKLGGSPPEGQAVAVVGGREIPLYRLAAFLKKTPAEVAALGEAERQAGVRDLMRWEACWQEVQADPALAGAVDRKAHDQAEERMLLGRLDERLKARAKVDEAALRASLAEAMVGEVRARETSRVRVFRAAGPAALAGLGERLRKEGLEVPLAGAAGVEELRDEWNNAPFWYRRGMKPAFLEETIFRLGGGDVSDVIAAEGSHYLVAKISYVTNTGEPEQIRMEKKLRQQMEKDAVEAQYRAMREEQAKRTPVVLRPELIARP